MPGFNQPTDGQRFARITCTEFGFLDFPELIIIFCSSFFSRRKYGPYTILGIHVFCPVSDIARPLHQDPGTPS